MAWGVLPTTRPLRSLTPRYSFRTFDPVAVRRLTPCSFWYSLIIVIHKQAVTTEIPDLLHDKRGRERKTQLTPLPYLRQPLRRLLPLPPTPITSVPPPQRHSPGSPVLPMQLLPVEELAEPVGPVSLRDLSLIRHAEPVHVLRRLRHRLVERPGAPVHEIEAVFLGVDALEEPLHVVPEAGDVARHGGDAAYEALGGSVPPGLVAAGKDAEVHAPDELVVVDGEDGARGAEEVRVEDDLYLFLLAVLEPRALEVVYDWVVAPVGDVVRCEWRCVVRLDAVEGTSEERV